MFLSINFARYIFIKRMLLVSVVTFLIMPVVWIVVSDYSQKKIVRHFVKTIGNKPANLVFEKLSIKMTQDNQKIMVLNTPVAKIYDLNVSRIDLENPNIIVSENNKLPQFLSATTGIYEQKTNMITVLDKVHLSQKKYFDINADKMLVDLNNFTIKLPNGVNGTYQTNSLKAQDVELQQKTNKAIFKGGVKLVIQPNENL